jgi:hypothetical protein
MKSISLRAATDKDKYRPEEPLSVKMTITNDGSVPANIVLPAGADHNRLFSYEIVEIGTRDRWIAAEFKPQSFSADRVRSIAPMEAIDFTQTHLRYRRAGDGKDEWAMSLPVGHYELTCVYDGQRAATATTRQPLLLRSQTMKFSIQS